MIIIGFPFRGKCIKHMFISIFTEWHKDSLRKPNVFISSNHDSDAGLVQSWCWIFIYSSKRFLNRKYIPKYEQLHPCHLKEQDLAIKTKHVLMLSTSSWSSPAPIQLWTFTVCAYLLSSLEHRVAFLCHCVHLWELYLKSLHNVPNIWAKSQLHLLALSLPYLFSLSLPP